MERVPANQIAASHNDLRVDSVWNLDRCWTAPHIRHLCADLCSCLCLCSFLGIYISEVHALSVPQLWRFIQRKTDFQANLSPMRHRDQQIGCRFQSAVTVRLLADCGQRQVGSPCSSQHPEERGALHREDGDTSPRAGCCEVAEGCRGGNHQKTSG